MPRERKKSRDTNITFHLFTLEDKDSMFRAKRATQHIIRTIVQGDGYNVIIREEYFDDHSIAKEKFEQYLTALRMK